MESVEKKVMKEIEELTLNQKMNMTQEEYETFRGLMFEILAVAQEEAFIVGAHWGIRMLFESFGYTNT